MPTTREHLANKLTEFRRQSAVDWLERELGEAERAVRDRWRAFEPLEDARKQLRDTYSGTDGEANQWEEQRKAFKQALQDEEIASQYFATRGSDVIDRVTPIKLLSRGTSFEHFEQAMTERFSRYGEDRQRARNTVTPLIDERPVVVLPPYSGPTPQASVFTAPSHLTTAVREALPPGAPDLGSPSSAAPPPYSPPSRSSTPPAVAVFQGGGQRPRRRGSGQ